MVEAEEKQLQDMIGMLPGLDEAAIAQAKQIIKEVREVLVTSINDLDKRRAAARGKDGDISHAEASRVVQGLDAQDRTQRDRAGAYLRDKLEEIGIPSGLATRVGNYLHDITIGSDRGMQ